MENTREMKNMIQIIYEYCIEKNISIHYINKLLYRKDYDEIENILNLDKGTLVLYENEYIKWIAENH
jgi:hypothetical protein